MCTPGPSYFLAWDFRKTLISVGFRFLKNLLIFLLSESLADDTADIGLKNSLEVAVFGGALSSGGEFDLKGFTSNLRSHSTLVSSSTKLYFFYSKLNKLGCDRGFLVSDARSSLYINSAFFYFVIT